MSQLSKARLKDRIEQLEEQLAAHKAIEISLHKGEQYLRTILEASPIGACIFRNTDNVVMFVNARCVELFGYSAPHELLGKSIQNHWCNSHQFLEFVTKLNDSESVAPCEASLVAIDNKKLIGMISMDLIELEQEKCILCWIHDITGRKEAEKQIRDLNAGLEKTVERRTRELSKSNESNRELFDSADISIWEEDLSGVVNTLNQLRSEGVTDLRAFLENNESTIWELVRQVKVIKVNQATLELFGADEECTLLRQIDKTFGSGAIDTFIDELCAIWDRRKSFRSETNFLSLDGKKIYAIISFQIPEDDDSFENVPISIVDITKRRLAEEQLMASEARYRSLIEATASIVWSTDESGGFAVPQRSWEEFTGQHWEEHKGYGWSKKIHPDDIERLLAEWNTARQELTFFESWGRMWNDNRNEWRDFAVRAVPIKNSAGVLLEWIGVTTDITEQIEVEKELLKARKLESVGLLAGGIAHDFNNILTGLFGNIDLAMMELPSDHVVYSYIQTASHALEKASNLTQQFLTFAKGGEPILEAISISQVIRDATNLSLSGSNVKTILHLPDDLWEVKADKGQLSQVVTNLAINADHAMPTGGTLVIEVENVQGCKDCVAPNISEKCVKLIVRDEGKGISTAHLDQIFDPYFTTKQFGSGLGLATVHSIIGRHNGTISVSSELGVGTTFTIYLPADTSLPEASENSPLDVAEGLEPAVGNVLFMDDDGMILDLAVKMLESFGYAVETAADGKQAIEKYVVAKNGNRPFDVVIMDLTIPGGMGGKEAVQELLCHDPQASVIVSSGYSTDSVMANYAEYGFKGRLAKPFQMNELKKEVSRLVQQG